MLGISSCQCFTSENIIHTNMQYKTALSFTSWWLRYREYNTERAARSVWYRVCSIERAVQSYPNLQVLCIEQHLQIELIKFMWLHFHDVTASKESPSPSDSQARPGAGSLKCIYLLIVTIQMCRMWETQNLNHLLLCANRDQRLYSIYSVYSIAWLGR